MFQSQPLKSRADLFLLPNWAHPPAHTRALPRVYSRNRVNPPILAQTPCPAHNNHSPLPPPFPRLTDFLLIRFSCLAAWVFEQAEFTPHLIQWISRQGTCEWSWLRKLGICQHKTARTSDAGMQLRNGKTKMNWSMLVSGSQLWDRLVASPEIFTVISYLQVRANNVPVVL